METDGGRIEKEWTEEKEDNAEIRGKMGDREGKDCRQTKWGQQSRSDPYY